MYTPQFRFLLVISILSIATWAYMMIDAYLFSQTGLNLHAYTQGVIKLLATFGAGYISVNIVMYFLRFKESRKTGFEEDKIDETGTKFNMKLALTKFLPKISAVPKMAGVSKLESELIGFLTSLGNLPYNIEKPEITLKDHAIKQWQAMCTLQGASQLHKVAALAQDLGKVHAYKAKTSPKTGLGKPTVTYIQHCPEKGGMAGVILSNMPSFRNPESSSPLADYNKKKALLTAIRYCKDPMNIPSNCDYLAKEIYDYLNKANLKARELAGEDISNIEPSAEEKLTLQKEITDYTPNILTILNITNGEITPTTNGFYMGKNTVAIKLTSLVHEILPLFTPETRNAFALWDLNTSTSNLVKPIVNTCQQNGWLVEEWEDHHAEKGLFNFQIGETPIPHCLLLNIEDPIFIKAKKHFKTLPPLPYMVDIIQSPDSQIKEIRHKASSIDTQLLEIFPR